MVRRSVHPAVDPIVSGALSISAKPPTTTRALRPSNTTTIRYLAVCPGRDRWNDVQISKIRLSQLIILDEMITKDIFLQLLTRLRQFVLVPRLTDFFTHLRGDRTVHREDVQSKYFFGILIYTT